MKYLITILFLFASSSFAQSNMDITLTKTLKYFPIGDSYTIGEGAGEENSFPAVLTKHLQQSGINIELVANPSRTGWTTQNAIDNELPLFKKSKQDFATLLIGVNDWVQEVSEETFHKNLIFLIEEMQNSMTNPSKLMLITIPDFSVTPDGINYGKGRNIADGLTIFNNIIKAEGAKRNLKVVDIFPLSQQMKNDATLIAADNLHPSAKEYALWEEIIFPVVMEMLK